MDISEDQINKDDLDPTAILIEEDEHEVLADDIIDPLADDIDPITGKKKVLDDDEEKEEDAEFEAYMFGDKYEEM